jgi:hypothetical protein
MAASNGSEEVDEPHKASEDPIPTKPITPYMRWPVASNAIIEKNINRAMAL